MGFLGEATHLHRSWKQVAAHPHLKIEMWGTQKQTQIPFGNDKQRDVDWWDEFSGYEDEAVAADGGDAVAGEGDASASGGFDFSDVPLPG